MTQSKYNVLMILTSNAQMGVMGEVTGLWFEELAAPYFTFTDANASVSLASIMGGPAPVDPRSLKPRGENDETVERFLAGENASAQLRNTLAIGEVNVSEFDAIFLPGGHGTMWDLPTSDILATSLRAAWTLGRVIAAVCHGPAGLVTATDEAGIPIVKGRRVTAFSDSEEKAVGLSDKVPFLLERRLRELGAQYECGPDFQAFAVRDGQLVTGQNPASSTLTARLTLNALSDKSGVAS